jgi:hypothetical protein
MKFSRDLCGMKDFLRSAGFLDVLTRKKVLKEYKYR